MLEAKIQIEAKDLTQAIEHLADAIGGAEVARTTTTKKTRAKKAEPVAEPKAEMPAPQPQSTPQPTYTEEQIQAMAAQQHAAYEQQGVVGNPQAAAPAQPSVPQPTQAPTPAPAPAPTQAPAPAPAPQQAEPQNATIGLTELSKAGAQLVDEGKMTQVMETVKKYNVRAITDLRPEQYPLLAADFRALGAQI